MYKIKVWFNQHFQGTFHHINALADTQRYDLLVSHGKDSVPIMHSNNESLSRAGIVRMKEPDGIVGKDYVKWCLSVCQENSVELFYPGKFKELIAARKKDFAAIGTKVLLTATAKTMRLVDTKDKFLEAVVGLVPVAPWKTFKTKKEFEKAWKEMGAGKTMSLCVKPVQGIYGSGFWRLTNGVSQSQVFDRAMLPVSQFKARMGSEMKEPWLLMQYCAGDERSVDCVAHNGELGDAVIRRKRSGGVQEIENNEEIIGYVAALVKKFKLSGLVNVQFKEHEGVMNILEINPRASGGSGMAYLANAQLMPLAVESFLNGKVVRSNQDLPYGMKIQKTQKYFTVSDDGVNTNESN